MHEGDSYWSQDNLHILFVLPVVIKLEHHCSEGRGQVSTKEPGFHSCLCVDEAHMDPASSCFISDRLNFFYHVMTIILHGWLTFMDTYYVLQNNYRKLEI